MNVDDMLLFSSLSLFEDSYYSIFLYAIREDGIKTDCRLQWPLSY
jgi:hypothetical protein